MEEAAKGTVAPTSAVAHSPPATAREEGPSCFLLSGDPFLGHSPSLPYAASPLLERLTQGCLWGFRTVKRVVSSWSQGRSSEEAGWMEVITLLPDQQVWGSPCAAH